MMSRFILLSIPTNHIRGASLITPKQGHIDQYKIMKGFRFEGVMCKSFNTIILQIAKTCFTKSFNIIFKNYLMVTIHGRHI